MLLYCRFSHVTDLASATVSQVANGNKGGGGLKAQQFDNLWNPVATKGPKKEKERKEVSS